MSRKTVASSVGRRALADADALSAAASALTATQTFTALHHNNTTTMTGNGGLNAIDVGSIVNAPLTLFGGPNVIRPWISSPFGRRRHVIWR